MEKCIEELFKKEFGRDIKEPALIDVLNIGDETCKHERVFYVDNAFDGQAWWCDDCPRHERMDYSPGNIIKFPSNALISTPNLKFGGYSFYGLRADSNGIVSYAFSRDDRIPRRDFLKLGNLEEYL